MYLKNCECIWTKPLERKKWNPSQALLDAKLIAGYFIEKKFPSKTLNAWLFVRKKALTVTFNSDISFCLSLYFFG